MISQSEIHGSLFWPINVLHETDETDVLLETEEPDVLHETVENDVLLETEEPGVLHEADEADVLLKTNERRTMLWLDPSPRVRRQLDLEFSHDPSLPRYLYDIRPTNIVHFYQLIPDYIVVFWGYRCPCYFLP